MPQITVWCLPPDTEEEKLRELHRRIVAAAVGIKELGLKDENDFLTLFPPDMMKYGAGTEIMVQVSELWAKPERTPEVKNRLARALGEVVKEMFPDTRTVAARVDPLFDPEQDGFWMVRTPEPSALDTFVDLSTRVADEYTPSEAFVTAPLVDPDKHKR